MPGIRVSIDLVPLREPPVSIDILQAGYAEHPLAGGGMVVFEELTPATIVLKFGVGGVSEDSLRELERLRTRFAGYHMLGFDDLACGQTLYVPVYIPRPPRNAQRPNARDEMVFGEFDLVCKQVWPWPNLSRVDLLIHGAVTAGNSKFLYYPEAAGRIVAIYGWIQESGTGGGPTLVQVSQAATDFLLMRGEFVAAGAGIGAAMTSAVLSGITSFMKGLPIELDIDATATNSTDLIVTLWCMMSEPYQET